MWLTTAHRKPNCQTFVGPYSGDSFLFRRYMTPRKQQSAPLVRRKSLAKKSKSAASLWPVVRKTGRCHGPPPRPGRRPWAANKPTPHSGPPSLKTMKSSKPSMLATTPIPEELGDLYQVLFHSQIASEQKRFTIVDVIREIHEMIRRHPHVSNETRQRLRRSPSQLEIIKPKSAARELLPESHPRENSRMEFPPAFPLSCKGFQLTRKPRAPASTGTASMASSTSSEETHELRCREIRKARRHRRRTR